MGDRVLVVVMVLLVVLLRLPLDWIRLNQNARQCRGL